MFQFWLSPSPDTRNMFMRRALRPQAFAAVRGMATGSGGKAKRSFFSSFSFRLGVVGAASAFAYVTIDKKLFHPAVENEVLEDLQLQKGGLVGYPTTIHCCPRKMPAARFTVASPRARLECRTGCSSKSLVKSR